uniref:Reverse transcriptase/retrotransposon-derived protein RNase H-like domain-containing protein n=1 Tax=Oryzias latipes TaxID=8090 RepID=A0A3B3ICC6_ORYLA
MSILQHKRPETVREMLAFLGLCGYSRHFLPCFVERTAPLRTMIKEKGATNLAAVLDWTPVTDEIFVTLVQDMACAAALAAPDYTQPFFLDATMTPTVVNAVLFQKNQGRRDVLMYCSISLDAVEARSPLCTRYAAGLAKVILKTAHIVNIITGIPSTDVWFQIVTGISGEANNWLLMVEQAANVIEEDCVVCMGPRPLLRVVPAAVPAECVADLMTNTIPFSPDCRKLDRFYPLAPSDKSKPVFDRRVAPQNFSCFVLRYGNGSRFIGNVTDNWCNNTQVLTHFQPLSRADIWIWCGTNQIFDRLPLNAAGRCALVTLILPVFIQPMNLTGVAPPLTHQPTWRRSKRETGWMGQNDPTYIDSLGVPRGVPDEYKLVNQVAFGFESILLWITPNKNVDRINYIHYNVQKLGNYTVAGFEAVHEQLKATSLMAFQNRIALDMLLAEKSGVCGIFGDQCCTFIPNNMQAGGKLSVAIEGMRTLNKKMKDHSGVDTSMWDDWMKVFGPWKNLISSILVAVAVFTAILTLCGCCCIPCIRSLLTRLIEKAVGDKDREHGQYAMLPVSDPFPPPQLSTQFV